MNQPSDELFFAIRDIVGATNDPLWDAVRSLRLSMHVEQVPEMTVTFIVPNGQQTEDVTQRYTLQPMEPPNPWNRPVLGL